MTSAIPLRNPPASTTDTDMRPDTHDREPRGSLPFGRGWAWTREGFRFFSASPLTWILCTIVMMASLLLLSFLPFISILVYLVSPIFYGGLMIGCRAIDSGSPLEIHHLFSGFRYRTLELASIGGLQLLGMIAIALLVAGIAYVAMGDTGLDMVEAGLSPIMIIAVLLAVGLMLPLAMAVWFAPAFVVLDEESALQAMKLSFSACMLNLLPLTCYSIVLLLMTLLVALTFGLGFLVVVPVLVGSVYAAYCDITSNGTDQPVKN
jgi:uncharacterized membrane protein